jgi:DNA mismatch endonuclease, patch repair protein
LAKFIFKTTNKRSKLMSKIRSANTKPELALRKTLWKLGLRYRLNVPNLKGKPDIVFNKYKVVVFVDGEFWHGYKWLEKKPKIKANRKYWIKKIERNIERDIENTKFLIANGYIVFRFWEHEIKKDLLGCVKKISDTILVKGTIVQH